MNILYSKNVGNLLSTSIPEFLSEGWIEYLKKCSDSIENRERGYRLLSRKLKKAGYQIAKDGTVYPF